MKFKLLILTAFGINLSQEFLFGLGRHTSHNDCKIVRRSSPDGRGDRRHSRSPSPQKSPQNKVEYHQHVHYVNHQGPPPNPQPNSINNGYHYHNNAPQPQPSPPVRQVRQGPPINPSNGYGSGVYLNQGTFNGRPSPNFSGQIPTNSINNSQNRPDSNGIRFEESGSSRNQNSFSNINPQSPGYRSSNNPERSPLNSFQDQNYRGGYRNEGNNFQESDSDCDQTDSRRFNSNQLSFGSSSVIPEIDIKGDFQGNTVIGNNNKLMSQGSFVAGNNNFHVGSNSKIAANDAWVVGNAQNVFTDGVKMFGPEAHPYFWK